MLECIDLRDSDSGSTARVLVGFGFNCFEFRVTSRQGPLDVLWSAADFDAGTQRASGSGIPLLFPFPGRIRGEVLRWDGRDYRLEAGDGQGNAIHGFVLDRPWTVIEQSERKVVGQFHAARDAPELLDVWPADFRITVSYALDGECLRSELVVDNPDDRPLPCGLGTHPYFRVPVGGQTAENCRVSVPVTKQWELRNLLATGRQLPVEDPAALRSGLEFGAMQFDAVFTALEFEGGRCVTAIDDPQSGLRVVQEFDRTFRECVVYTPPHREAICIEPYTCVPGAHELREKGIDSGLRVLAPQESFSARLEIRVEPISS